MVCPSSFLKKSAGCIVFFAELPPFGAGLLKNTQILPGLSNSLSALGGEKGHKIIQLGNTNYIQYCAALSLHVHGWATFPRSMEKLFFWESIKGLKQAGG